MAKFQKFKSLKLNGHGVPSMLAMVSCSVLLLGGLGGCTPGMLGDMGGKPNVTMIGEALTPVNPDQIKVVFIGPPGTSTYNPLLVDKYIKKHYPNSKPIADIMASSSGYGDNVNNAEKKLVKMAGKLGGNTVLITGTNEAGGELGNVMGDKVTTVSGKVIFVQN